MLADGIANYVDCHSGVKNYYVCDWCFLTESQTLCGIFYLFWFMMLQDQLYPTDGASQEPRWYVVVYLSLSSGEFTSTSSLIYGSWYLPIFLFRDGSSTLMRIASLMDLAMFWSPLSTILKLSMDMSCPMVL